jgi:hypothetical protein
MLNPWIFGVQVLQQGWRAQSALAFILMRSFAGGDQTVSSPLIPNTAAVDIKAREEALTAIAHAGEAPAAITNEQKAPAITDARGRKSSKVLRASKKISGAKPRNRSKRAAAAGQNSARKAVRRSARKPR